MSWGQLAGCNNAALYSDIGTRYETTCPTQPSIRLNCFSSEEEDSSSYVSPPQEQSIVSKRMPLLVAP